MMRLWLISLLIACGAAPPPTTIHTGEDYEHVVVEVVDRVVEIFKDAGINCQMISSDLRTLNDSQKVAAGRAWRKDHPEAGETMKKVISERKAELEKVMGPAARQCEGPIKGLIAELTE